MIFKLLGITLIMVSSSLIGFGFFECMSSRERELRNLSDAVSSMINELDYSLDAVKFLFQKALPTVKGDVFELFEKITEYIAEGKSANEAWSISVREKAAVMCLTKSDCNFLVNCADAFSAHEVQQQKSQLKGLQSRILVLADAAAEAKRKNGKLVQILGVYGGVFLCAVLF